MEITPRQNIIMEGLYFADFDFDEKIFINVPVDEQLRRKIIRDKKERGRDENFVREQFKTIMENYDSEQQIKIADIILDGTLPIADIVNSIQRILKIHKEIEIA